MSAKIGELPLLALSVRQPWAHAIVMGWKPVENRNWRQPNPGLSFRGRVAIHASSGMTRREYDEAAQVFALAGFTCPRPHELTRGAIIGSVTVVDVVKNHPSPWYFGPRALLLADAAICDPIPCRGALGFFPWRREDDFRPLPSRWMLPAPVEPTDAQIDWVGG